MKLSTLLLYRTNKKLSGVEGCLVCGNKSSMQVCDSCWRKAVLKALSKCSYNFCKGKIIENSIPCKCTEGHIQPCCNGKVGDLVN